MSQSSISNPKLFTVWVVEAKEPANELLRAALEAETRKQGVEPPLAVRFIPEADILKPMRFALLPDLLILSCEFRPAFDAFVKAAGGPPVWLDLTYQTARTVEAFRALCQMRGLEGSALELGHSQMGWTLKLLDSYRLGHGSLLHCIPPAKDQPTPLINSSRLTRADQIGMRIDHLAGLAGGQSLDWYLAVTSLTALALEFAAELKTTSTTVLPLYAAELHQGNWLIVFQIPVPKAQQARLPQLMAKLREDPGLRAKFAFKVATRECGALTVTFSENVVEVGAIFNPAETVGARLLDPQQAGREAILFRKRHYTAEFNPHDCRYAPFPERLRASPEPAEFGNETEETPVKVPGSDLLNRDRLKNVFSSGSDESFAAFLKGVDAAGGQNEPRYLRLVSTLEKPAGAENREVMLDLFKRFFALVEEARVRRLQQRTG